MEQLIILIIIGIAGAIFNRMTKKTNTEKPTSTTVHPRKERMLKHFENVITEVKQKAQVKTVEQDVINEEIPSPVEHLEDLKRQEELYNKKIEDTKKRVLSIKNKETKPLLSDENDIVKGIILSEVLGPPRSKKPYRR